MALGPPGCWAPALRTLVGHQVVCCLLDVGVVLQSDHFPLHSGRRGSDVAASANSSDPVRPNVAAFFFLNK